MSVTVGVAICLYQYFPGILPATSPTLPPGREALVFALFAATLFLVSLVPGGPPENRVNLPLTRILQVIAGLATFAGALNLVGSVAPTFTGRQLIAIWGIVITGVAAAAICYGAVWWGMIRGYREGKSRGPAVADGPKE